MKKISIIIPHYNNYEILVCCIQSIKKSHYTNYEIIVVNNASTDDSIDRLSNEYSDIKIINSRRNLGYAGGCNLGAKSADGDYLIFLNNDTEHDSNWIETLASFLDENSNVASVQPKIRNMENKEQFDYAGACGGYLDILCYPFSRGRIFNTIENDNGQYDLSKKIFWASGTAFITKKDIFNKIGGFDNYFFAHMEEIDYHWKCQLMGYEVWCEPQSIVYHYGGKTLDYDSCIKTYLNHRNSIIMLLTNFSFKFSLLLLLPRILLEIISFCKHLFSFKPLHALSQLRAIIMVLIRFDIVIKRRIEIKKIRKINDLELLKNIYKKSIVMEYFIKRKKKFSNINF